MNMIEIGVGKIKNFKVRRDLRRIKKELRDEN